MDTVDRWFGLMIASLVFLIVSVLLLVVII
jgi:hypothetical protein